MHAFPILKHAHCPSAEFCQTVRNEIVATYIVMFLFKGLLLTDKTYKLHRQDSLSILSFCFYVIIHTLDTVHPAALRVFSGDKQVSNLGLLSAWCTTKQLTHLSTLNLAILNILTYLHQIDRMISNSSTICICVSVISIL